MNPADVAQAAPQIDMSFWTLFWHAHIVVKLVMLGLIGASIWCWSIIIDKTLLYRRTRRDMDAFEEGFWSGRSSSPFSGLCCSGWRTAPGAREGGSRRPRR